MAGKLFNIYSGNTGGVLSTSTTKVGSFRTTSDDFYSVNFDTGRKSIWTNNIEFGRAADWGNISGIPTWIGSDGVTWADVKDKPATATRWPYWSEILSKPAAIGSATQPVYWDGSTFQLVNSVAPASHDHDDKYLKLTGGTLSGDLAFSHGSSANDQHITWASGTNYQRLKVRDGQTDVFIFQYSTDSGTTWSDYFTIQNGVAKIGTNTVYHSGNLPAYPTVNNGALNLQASGTTKVTFYANQSGTSNFNIATGSTDGTISVGGTDVAVKGLGSNAYTSTAYLPLAGGQMTGNITWKNSTALPEQSSPQYFLVIDAFTDGGATKWASKANTLNALTGLTSTAKGTSSKPIYWDGTKFVECLAYSQASVNYANSAGSVEWSNVQNKPSTFTPSAHDHTYLKKNFKSTGITNIPFTGEQFEYGILTGATNGVASPEDLTAFDSYSQVEYINLPWYSDLYGGQLMFGANSGKIGYRTIHNGTWSVIKEIIHSGNYTNYTVKKDGTGATGTWGISITGNAGSADKLKTARTITINGSSKTFDGTGNISWSLADLNLPSNEHNHDDRYLKLSGGTMTGAIKRHYAAASDDPFYSVTSNNLDIWVWRVMHNASAASVSTSASYGFGLKYLGAGDGNNNDLALYSDNQTGTQVEAIRIKQDGAVTFSKQISSTLATGTSPFNVTSTTVNTNLNADLLDGVHANGLFTNFSNKTVSGNKVLAATIGGKELTVAVEYAGSSNTANSATTAAVLLTNNTSQNADSCYTGAPGLRFWRYNGTSSTTGQSGGDGWILSWSWNQGSVGGQIYLDDNPSKTMCIRGFNNSDSTFTTWAKILHTDNISPSLPISGNTIAVTVGGVTSSYITVPYATSAGNADTLDTFHATDLFQTFTNDATNNAVKIKIGNTEKSLVVGYATKANSANSADGSEYLNYYSVSDPNTAYKDHVVKWFSQISGNSGYSGTNYGFPISNNANGVLWLGTHSGNYGGQIGISSNGNIYYRYISAGNFSTAANGASWQVLLTSNNYTTITDARYVKKAGDTMTGLLTTTSGDSHDGIKVGNTYINAINGELILQNNSAIRFGGDSWDYNVWAGLKYVHSSKTIYLGLADGSSFTANSAQSGGKLYLPGIDNIYTGNGTNLIWHGGNDGSGSGLDADLLDGKHADDFLYRLRRSNNNVTGQPNNGMIPPAILEFLSAGYPVYTDPEFASGNNSCSVYNNQGNGTVTIERIADNQGSGNSSGYILKITTNGTASPAAGGFYQTINSRANAIFMQVFRAKVPVGWSVYNAENAQGDNATITWLTDRAGTGKWEWYARLVYCGNTGSFSNGGHVYLSGTSNTSVTWYLSHITLVDITKGNYNGLRTRYADHATSSDSASSVAWANITGKATSKTAWGQTFVDSSGNIQSIYGNMTSVGQVTPDGNATRDNGTSSANWSSVYSYNLRSNDNLTLRSGTSKDIIFQTNAGTEYMRLTSSGKLGLGRVPTASDARLTMPANSVAIDFRPDHSSYNAKVEYMTSGNEALVFATKASVSSFIFMNGVDLTDRSDYGGVGTPALQIKSNGVAINRPVYGDNGMFYNDPGASGTKLVVGGLIKTISNGKYLVIGCENGSWAHHETDAAAHYFSPSIHVNGDIWVYNTSWGIKSDGKIYGSGFYHSGNQSNDYVILGNGGTKQWSVSKVANTIVARTGDNYIYNGYYNSDISNEDSLTPGSVYFAQSGEGWIRKQSIGKFADNLRSNEIISIDKSLTVTEAWMDTGIVCDTTTFPRGTGTYAVQVCAASMTEDSYYPYYSGIMTIYTSTTNSGGNDEVALHCAGHAVGTDYKRLYIRTQEQAKPNYNKIQIAGSSNLSKAYTITFKFRKLI